MPKRLTPQTTLDTLKKDAKRWLKSVRAGDGDALERLRALNPKAGAEPGLRDVQHALARDYGFDGWPALKEELAGRALGRLGHREKVDIMLHHVWNGDRTAAERLVAHDPSIAGDGLLTAIVFGDLDAVKRRLSEDPAAATRKGGPLDWEPILYLAYGRLPVPAFAENSLAMANLLFDHGADPNAFFDDGWGNPFKVLTGVIGLGEGVRPPHPRAIEMARLIIERGGDPYDTQTLYNTSIVNDDIFWLDFLYNACETRGRTARWHEASRGLGGKLKLPAIDYLLGNAVAYDHLRRADWLLDHGADPNGPHAYSGRKLREEAMVYGHVEMAALLERYGAETTPLPMPVEFQAACVTLDHDRAREIARLHPECLAHAGPMLIAARKGRADIVALLLDLGMNVDVMDEGEIRGIHLAAGNNAIDVAKLLIEHGTDIDRPTKHYGGAMGFASHFGHREMLDFLAPQSRDVWNLAYEGYTGRLAELFAEEPALVNTVRSRSGATPLFFLPDDEDKAVEMAEFLLAHGADTRVRNKEGETPEQTARKRGLDDAADVIRDGT